MLAEAGLIGQDPKTGRYTRQVSVEGRAQRVVVMLRGVFDG
jgi:hypothetical protein